MHPRLSLNVSSLSLRRAMRQQLHCSAAVQIAPDLSDVCVRVCSVMTNPA